MSRRTYTELTQFTTFEERLRYLRLDSMVGADTFGFDRYLNQRFYRSAEWRAIRHEIIVRDSACDLGLPDYEIDGKIYIHHMNPITVDDLEHSSIYLLNPEFLICVSHATHNAVHYGSEETPQIHDLIERRPNDTIPWRISK